MAKEIKDTKYIRATSLFGLDKYELPGAASLTQILKDEGISPQSLEKPDLLIPFAAFARVVDRAAIEWKHPHIGLEWIWDMRETFPHLGGIMFLAKLNRTMGEWVEDCIRYNALHTNAFDIILKKDVEKQICKVEFKQNYAGDISVQLLQQGFANICMTARIVANRLDEHPIELNLRQGRPNEDGFDELARNIFGCPINFNSACDELVFPLKYLDYKIDGSLAFLQKLMRKQVQKRVDALGIYDARVSDMVRHAIPGLFGTRNCNFAAVSEMLNIDERKLYELLRVEGVNFKEILLEIRIEKACDLLKTSDIGIEELANFLDYTSSTAFSFAFKKATGTSPLAYRHQFQTKS